MFKNENISPIILLVGIMLAFLIELAINIIIAILSIFVINTLFGEQVIEYNFMNVAVITLGIFVLKRIFSY